MDPVMLIEVALTAGVAAGVKDATSSAVKDAYEGLKAKVKGRLAGRPDAGQVLAAHEAAPQTWKESLSSELAAVGVDGELVTAAQELMRLIDAEGTQAGKYEVDVDCSQGVQIGDHNVQHNTFVASAGGARGSGFGPALAGMPGFRFHDLRHTGQTMAAATRATIKDLMRRLGHASPAASNRYLHAVDGRDAEIASALSELAAYGDAAKLPRSIMVKH
jgi:hypothetical protein